MDPQYQNLRSTADRLYHKCIDYADDKNAAAALITEVRNLGEDFEMNKRPRSIEDRLKQIIAALDRIESDGGHVMDANHADALRDDYEDLRRALRQLPNY